MNKPNEEPPMFYPAPYVGQDSNRIDVNLIAMLLWQSLLTGTSVAVSHMGWYLPDAGPAEMGLQYGLIAFGFLCTAMVLFHVGGIRDSLAMRAEFAKENQVDKWMRGQQRLHQRRANKRNYWQQQSQQQAQQGYQQFGIPQPREENDDKES